MKKYYMTILLGAIFMLSSINVSADSISTELLLGKWIEHSMIHDGEVYSSENNSDAQNSYFEFREDGSAVNCFNGDARDGVWSLSGDAVVVDTEERQDILGMENGLLKQTISDNFYFYYEKQQAIEKTDNGLIDGYDQTTPQEDLSDFFADGGNVMLTAELTPSGYNRYYFCHLNQAGFDSSVDYFGLYDYGTKTWPIELRTFDFYFGDMLEGLSYVGDGVFSYAYHGYYGWTRYYFSAPLKDYFYLDFNTYSTSNFFEGGYIVGDLEDDQYGVVSVYGEITRTGITGGTMVYQSDNGFVMTSGWDGEVEEALMYFYDTHQAVSIEENYATKITDATTFYMTKDYLYIKNLMGMDGMYYYAVFDKTGALVIPATSMDEFDLDAFRSENGILVYDDEICRVTLVDEYYNRSSDAMADDMYIMQLYIENKTDKELDFSINESIINETYLFPSYAGTFDGNEGQYVTLQWGWDEDFNDLDVKEVYSAALRVVINDWFNDEILLDKTIKMF